MKVLFNVFLGLMCLMAGVSAQFGECIIALKSFENTSEGQTITNCGKLAESSDMRICSHSECQHLELPSRLKSICTDLEGEVVYKALELNFKQINAIVKKVCQNDNSGLNSLIGSTQSIVNDDKKSDSTTTTPASTTTSSTTTSSTTTSSTTTSSTTSSSTTSSSTSPASITSSSTIPASTTPVTTAPANATAEDTINGLPNAAPSSIKISSSFVYSMVLISISLLLKY